MQPNHHISIAPMMDWTDRHYRYFMRLISKHVLLYTEMITTGALIYGDRERFLKYAPIEHPIAIQLGGSDPKDLAQCARYAEQHGYDEVNLNVGCPSDRVQSGRFGACLMAEPDLVAECITAMRNAVNIPVTVKTRLGIDQQDTYEHLHQFIQTVATTGCETFIIHARKAWLKGLSPKENREIPPLKYELVQRVKQDFPQLKIIINGGIKTLIDAEQHQQQLDGVMIGREAYHNPYILATVDRDFYHDDHPILSREEIAQKLIPYIDKYLAAELAAGARVSNITRHILGLFQGVPGAKAWRRYLSEHAHLPGAGSEIINEALAVMKLRSG